MRRGSVENVHQEHSKAEKIFGAVFYGVASLLIMLVNKYVFAAYHFPSSNFLALCQFLATPILLLPLRGLGYIDFPRLSYSALLEVFPLPLLFLGNTVFGLMGTKMLSIPMFSVLRRLTLLFTLILEKMILSYPIKTDVALALAVMIFGSVVAAADDLAFDLYSYVVILLNNLFTALSGVVSKLKLNKPTSPQPPKAKDDEEDEELLSNGEQKESEAKTPVAAGLGTWGLMFYNSIFSAPLLLLTMMLFTPQDYEKIISFESWNDIGFIILFSLSTIMGTVLQFSIIYCTKVNSALATNVTGSIKNVLTTYIGMIAPGLDYTYSTYNFIGVNVSMLGGLYYARLQLVSKKK